jgi:hypothetical protein
MEGFIQWLSFALNGIAVTGLMVCVTLDVHILHH